MGRALSQALDSLEATAKRPALHDGSDAASSLHYCISLQLFGDDGISFKHSCVISENGGLWNTLKLSGNAASSIANQETSK